MMNTKLKASLVVIFSLFLLLFNTPFLSIPDGMVSGLPKIMIYIGTCWIILIILMGMISSRRDKEQG